MTHENISSNHSLQVINAEMSPFNAETIVMEKPEGYIAKDVIYGIIKAWEESGNDVQGIPNQYIAQKIKEQFNGFEEGVSTISAYKSQYKKSFHFRPSLSEGIETELGAIFKIGFKLAPTLRELIKRDNISKETLKIALNSLIDSIE